MFDPWYDGSNDYEGALLRTESEPPVFGDEGESGGIRMRVKIDGKVYDTTKADSLIGLSATDLPREFLEGLPIKYVAFLGIAWEDCYPVSYDEDLTVDDVLDSNSWLLWEKASGEDLVIDDSYEYVRPKTKEEKEEEHEEE